MQKTGTTGRMLNTVLILLLFCAFAMAMVLTLFSGTGVYRSIQEHMESQYTERTALAYLETKIHHYDTVGAVVLEPFAATTALVLYETVDGVLYKTVIYSHEGYLKELFSEAELMLTPEAGQRVIAVNNFEACFIAQDLLQLICTTPTGEQADLLVYLHSEGEVMHYA